MRYRALAVLLVLWLVVPAPAGAAPGVAGPRASPRTEPRVPVVFIPGITGSKLRDRRTGKLIWGRAGNLFVPHDGGRSLALPIEHPPALGDGTEASDVIERLTLLGLLRVKIYAPLIRALERSGYVRGNLRAPRPEDSFLVFPYDWRHGNVETAHEMAGLLEHLREVRGEPTLRVVLLCHSNAANIARWYLKYGGATIAEAEAGRAAPPPDVRVEKVIFVGTAQGGGVSTLVEMNRGKVYVPIFGRTLRPEYMFTLPGLYEELPAPGTAPFLDEQGEPREVDLFDPRSWELYGWSIYSSKTGRRLARLGEDDPILGDRAARRRWLDTQLTRAREVHELLHRDAPGFPATRYYQVQSVSDPTPSRLVLVRARDGRWRTLPRSACRVRHDRELESLVTAPGDGYATRQSQEWLSPQEQAAVAGADFSIRAHHRKMLANPAALRRVLEFLAD